MYKITKLFNHISTIRRLIGVLKWQYPPVTKVIPPVRSDEKRLLIIYDFASQTFSLGDFLNVQEASLVNRKIYNVDTIDFAMVCEPKQMQKFPCITEKNYMYHISSIFPITYVNPYVGSVYFFNSYLQLHRFIADNIDLYHIWPPAWEYIERGFLNLSIYHLLYDYYMKHSSIPYLECSQFLVEWAQSFYMKHGYPDIPVTVQIRNNKFHELYRNSNIASWLDFFSYCNNRYPVKFFVIGAINEIDDRMRQYSNVVIVKDFHTRIDQDLALVYMAATHIGASSGPSAIAHFNKKPYAIVNCNVDPSFYNKHMKQAVRQQGNIIQYFFSEPFQYVIVQPETTEILIEFFERMWKYSDKNYYISQKRTDNNVFDIWLR